MKCNFCKRTLPNPSLITQTAVTDKGIIEVVKCIWCDVEYWSKKNAE